MAFLRARLDQDEIYAHASMEENGAEEWVASTRDDVPSTYPHHGVWADGPEIATVRGAGTRRHIARHDPARVLAEVDAKRRLVDLLVGVVRGDYIDDGEPALATRMLPYLALPYASHPDYRPEWAPAA